MSYIIDVDAPHLEARNITPKFRKNGRSYFHTLKVRKKFIKCLGIDEIKKNEIKPNLFIEETKIVDNHTQIRFVVETEKGMFVPCYLLIPNTNKDKYPLAITLQGHAPGGMYHSLGIIKNDGWDKQYQPRGAFALQAIENGFASLCVELRGMGELKSIGKDRQSDGDLCRFSTRNALLLGRTILGERLYDISKILDILPKVSPLVDMNDILVTGNSGGGTVSYYLACYDKRIKLSAPSCSFCSYNESIQNVSHCPCNYIPGAYKYFDMQDLACLIYPRKLLVIAGKDDEIFPLIGVTKAFNVVKSIYKNDNARMVVTPKNHYWCEDIVWSEINKIRRK